jgi:hypothetical protein
MLSAVVGGSAVVAMAALGAAVGQQADSHTTFTAAKMNVGATSTETTPSAVPAVAKAAPAIKGPARFKANA